VAEHDDTAARSKPVGQFGTPDGMAPQRELQLVEAVLAGTPEGRELTDEETGVLLATAGIPLVPYRRVHTGDAAVAAAEELGYPVAMKATAEQWRHRADVIGVRLDLPGPDAVRGAHADLAALTGSAAVYVQRMAPKGGVLRLRAGR